MVVEARLAAFSGTGTGNGSFAGWLLFCLSLKAFYFSGFAEVCAQGLFVPEVQVLSKSWVT